MVNGVLIYSSRSVWAKTDHGSPYQKFSFMQDKSAARATNLGALANYRDGPRGVSAAVKQVVVGKLVPIMTANFPNGLARSRFWERLPDRHQ